VGTFGRIGCFSYNEFKHISCGDGGAASPMTTISPQAASCWRQVLRPFAGALDRNATFLANNYRMTELQAAVAIAQLAKLDSIIRAARKLVRPIT